MKRRLALIAFLLFSLLFLLQCSGSGKPGKPGPVGRTVEDVHRDLQAFKTVIRAELGARANFVYVVGGLSVLVNIFLFGFVLYYKKRVRLLSPAKEAKKEPVKKRKPAPVAEEKAGK